ncbi:MAG: peptidylprolyl isomerase [Candidatus Latescibacteria bacterium]|nr:peptidylprolyl isomerase [Candidatus Latescibacterota bacterium]
MMNRRISLPILFLAVLLSGCGNAQDRAVVTVAGKRLTVKDLNLLAGKLLGENPRKGMDSLIVKRQIVDAFIARELLVLEGEARHLDRDEQIAGELQKLERELLIRAVYDKDVLNRNIEVMEQEIADLYGEWGSGEEVRASHILCRTEEEANSLLDELRRGVSFEEVAKKRSIHAQSAITGGDMGYMRKELLLSELRDQVWPLGIGKLYPHPLKSKLGYHLIKVTDHRTVPLDSMRTVLTGEIERRKRDALKAAYDEVLRKRYTFRWHDDVALLLVNRHGAVSAGDSSKIIADWTGGQITVAEYLKRLRHFGGVKRALADTSRAKDTGERVTFDDLLITEARRKGYTKDETIVEELNRKKAALFGQKLFEIEVEKKTPVTEESLRSFYDVHRTNYRMPPSVSLREILVDDRALADSLKSLVLAGAAMDDLARKYSERLGTRENGGRLGPLNERTPGLSELARYALKAEPGVIQGPVPASGGFSIFKVIDRSGERTATLEEAQEIVRTDMLDRAMDRFIASLRTKYASQIRVNEKGLESKY